MKMLIVSLFVLLLLSANAFTQTPHAINYQAIARDTNGILISNQNISLRISILSGSITGLNVYSEIHITTTNSLGLVNIAIGDGQVENGNFSAINWGTSSHFIKTELDESGGANYQLMGASQLLSVPYALYAEKSGDAGAENINELNDGKTGGNSVFLGAAAGANDDGSWRHNVGIGVDALSANTTGTHNVSLGYRALLKNTSGYRNTAIGYKALQRNTTGIYNTATGAWALNYDSTGSYNTAYGYRALYFNTTGESNTATGSWALLNNTSGSNNTAIGRNANFNNVEGSNNTIIGYEAGSGIVHHSKSGNVLLGYKAGFYDTTDNKLYIENSNSSDPLIYGEFDNDLLRINGDLEVTGTWGLEINNLSDARTGGNSVFLGFGAGDNDNGTDNTNVAVGIYSLQANTSGEKNSAYGYRSLFLNSTGKENVALGHQALFSNISGNRNTIIGCNTNTFNQTGSNNTIIGYEAGRYNNFHSKSGNIFLGYKAGYYDTTDNKLYIENSNSSTPLIYGEFDNDILAINGSLGVGTSSPLESAALEVSSTTKGFLPPRMTNAQISAISGPSDGLMVFSTDDEKVYVFVSSEWKWKEIQYGNGVLTPPPSFGAFTDARDGNTYTTVQIGTQIWMAENLAFLPSVGPPSIPDTIPSYCVYDYLGTNISEAKATINYQECGVLYDWLAAMSGSSSSNTVPSGVRGICPNGWHLPSDEEWKILEGEIDSQYGYPDPEWNGSGWRGTDAGGKLKGAPYWIPPNNGATNSTGFTALPCGGCGLIFVRMSTHGYFWSSTEETSLKAWPRNLENNYSDVRRDSDEKSVGCSVRCIKD